MSVLEIIAEIAIILGMFSLVGMAVVIWKEISHFKKTSFLTKLENMPSVGPHGNIIGIINSDSQKEKFLIKIKNYGETPADNVTGNFITQDHSLSKKSVKNSHDNQINIGPLLPSMESDCWFHIDSDTMQKARSNVAEVHIGLYISYDFEKKKSGYGMIGHFDSHENDFVKTEMWED